MDRAFESNEGSSTGSVAVPVYFTRYERLQDEDANNWLNLFRSVYESIDWESKQKLVNYLLEILTGSSVQLLDFKYLKSKYLIGIEKIDAEALISQMSCVIPMYTCEEEHYTSMTEYFLRTYHYSERKHGYVLEIGYDKSTDWIDSGDDCAPHDDEIGYWEH